MAVSSIFGNVGDFVGLTALTTLRDTLHNTLLMFRFRQLTHLSVVPTTET